MLHKTNKFISINKRKCPLTLTKQQKYSFVLNE